MTNKNPLSHGMERGVVNKSNKQYHPHPNWICGGRSPLRFRAPGPQLRSSLAKRRFPAIVGWPQEQHQQQPQQQPQQQQQQQQGMSESFATMSGMVPQRKPVTQVKYIIAQESSPRSLHTQITHAICKAIFAPILGCNGHCYKKKDQVKG